MKPGRAVGMTGARTMRKTKPRFHLRFPRPLETAARFPHFHRPYGVCVSKPAKPNSRKETLAADRCAPALRLILQ